MEYQPTNIRKNLIRVAIATGLILLVPLVAMRFTSEVKWGSLDFLVIGTLLFGAGAAYVLIASQLKTTQQRIALGVILLVTLLAIWAELAVDAVSRLLSGQIYG